MTATALILVGAVSCRLDAQWAATYRQAPLREGSAGEFAATFATAAALNTAIGAAQASTFETLWSNVGERAAASDAVIAARAVQLSQRGPRFSTDSRQFAPAFAKVAPEAIAVLDWARSFQRQAYDLLADPAALPADRDGRIAELVEYYRSRHDLALATVPKSPDLVDAQAFAFGFRRGMPKANAVSWAHHWFDLALFEPLVTTSSPPLRAQQEAAIVHRFRMMMSQPGDAPRRIPLAPGVAPEFARRYPGAAAIVDNLHLFEDAVADVLAAREIPRSAKRREILGTMARFQSASANDVDYSTWMRAGEIVGVANMGGQALDTVPPRLDPAVDPGASIAGLLPAAGARGMAMPAHSDTAPAPMAGMELGTGAPMSPDSALALLRAIQQRMMADPVIRERVATDPVLQRLFAAVEPMARAPGIDTSMSGMSMPKMSMPKMSVPTLSPAAVELAVRLLSDPAVQARVHAKQALHAMWSDPAVQRRLDESKRTNPPMASMGGMPGMTHPTEPTRRTTASRDATTDAKLVAIAKQLGTDSVVQRLIAADSTLRRLWADPAVRRTFGEK